MSLVSPARSLRAVPWPGFLAAFGIAAAVVALFHRAIFDGWQFYHSDVHAMVYPLKALVAESLRGGRIPLWDPSSLCGYPVLDSYIAAPFLPQNLLFVLLPFDLAFGAFVVLKHVLAGLFQLLFLRRIGVSTPAAASAGLLFALSGPLLSLADFHAFAFECVPLVLWAWWRHLEARDGETSRARTRSWALAVVAVAFLALHGDLQTLYAALLLAGLLPLGRPRASVRGLAGATTAWAGAAAGAMVLAAIQLLPPAMLLGETNRAALSTEERMLHSLTPRAAPQIIWPVDADAAATSPEFIANKYLGLGTALLAAAGLVLAARRPGPRRRLAVWLASVCGIALLLSLGRHGPLLGPLAEVLPGLTLFRYPEKWLGYLSFAATALAALGIDAVGRRHGRVAVVLAIAAIADLAVPALAFVNARLVPGWVYSPDHLPRIERHAPAFSPHDRILRLPTNGPMDGRSPPTLAGDGDRHEERARAIAWNIESLLGNNAWRAGLRSVSGLSSFSFASAETLWREAAARGAAARVADLMAARWILTSQADADRLRSRLELRGLLPGGAPAASWRSELGELVLYERGSALPRAFVAGAAHLAATQEDAVATLLSPQHDPRRTVIILADGAVPEAGTAETLSEGAVEFLADDPDRIVLALAGTSRTEGWLVVNDSFHAGWTARVDGVATPVLRANLFARAVRVPPGSRQVEMRFEPWTVPAGAALSGAGLLALAALTVRGGRRSAHRHEIGV